MVNSQPQYETNDFKIMVYLYAMGYKILGMSGYDRRRVLIFEDDGTIKDAILRYLNKDQKIEINEIFDAQDRVKTIIYQKGDL